MKDIRDWEIEFNEQFVRDDGLMDKYMEDIDGDPLPTAEAIKSFIHNMLYAHRSSLIKQLEAEKDTDDIGWGGGLNAGIQRAIDLLNKEK